MHLICNTNFEKYLEMKNAAFIGNQNAVLFDQNALSEK